MSDIHHYLERELEDKIKNDPQIWRFIRQSSLDGVWYWDLENPENEYMSPEFWKLFGFDPAQKQHLASEWQDLIFPDDLEVAKQNLERHLADPGHAYDQVVRYRCADGETAWVRCRGIAVRDEAGRPIRLLGAHNDLTALMRERAINDANRLLNLIMETAESAIVALGTGDMVVAINTAGRHVLGEPSAPTPFPWPEKIAFVDREGFQPLDASRSPVMRALAGATLRGEISAITRGRSTDFRYVRVSSAPVAGHDVPLKCVLIIDDVTEQEKSRQQVERSSRLDALGQLTGGIAHDFNNLLATIQYALQLASDTPDSDRRHSLLDIALRSVGRGSELTGRLLAFARRQPGVAKSHNVAEFIAEFEKFASPLIEANVSLDFDASEPDLWVYCESAQLENALLNLLLNSRDAIMRAGSGGRVRVSARGLSEVSSDAPARPGALSGAGVSEAGSERAHRYVEFAVTDNGPGMSAEVKRRATDPFFSTKEGSAGTGLGLSMIYGFVQQSGGELQIYSEETHGTTVRMILPRGTLSGPREAPIKRLPPAQGAGERILLVEDEPSLLMMMNDLITSLGYRVGQARSALEALHLIDAGEAFDLILTDIVMPGGMGGFQLAREVRARRPDMPIIYMSGYTGFSETEMSDVVAPLLPKPCPPRDLAAAIRRALQGTAQPTAP